MIDPQRELWLGTLYAFFAFVIWGALPVYWKVLGQVPPAELLAHRILWAGVLLVIAVPVIKRRELRSAFRDPRAVLAAILAGVLLGANWFLYIWAISVERIVEASLGYYINPLVNVLLGVIFLRERLTRAQTIALGLAISGVLVLAISHGSFPWVSVGLAFSFGIYGLVKKTGRLGNIVSMLFELTLLFPAALVYVIVLARAGDGSFAAGDGLVTAMLAGAGVVTVAPLLLFGASARRIPLSRVGFLQYIAPTSMLLIGTLVYGEPFGPTRAVSFALIWAALAIYTATLLRGRGRARRKPATV